MCDCVGGCVACRQYILRARAGARVRVYPRLTRWAVGNGRGARENSGFFDRRGAAPGLICGADGRISAEAPCGRTVTQPALSRFGAQEKVEESAERLLRTGIDGEALQPEVRVLFDLPHALLAAREDALRAVARPTHRNNARRGQHLGENRGAAMRPDGQQEIAKRE